MKTKVWNIELNTGIIIQSFGRTMTEAIINAQISLAVHGNDIINISEANR